MILNSLNLVRSIVIKSIAGTENAIVFLGKNFVADKAYNSLNDAIRATAHVSQQSTKRPQDSYLVIILTK